MRLFAAAACLLLGCEARAQTSDPPQSPVPVVVPAGWVPMQAIADAGLAAATDAARARAMVVRTWGEPSLGCFATVVEITGTRDEHLARVAETFRATLANGAQIDDWVFTDGVVAEVGGAFTRGALRGAVRGRLAADAAGVPRAAFAACFYNERDPARCQAACAGLLASLESPKVSP